MRSVAQVHHGAHTVQADGRVLRQTLDDLDLTTAAAAAVAATISAHTTRVIQVCGGMSRQTQGAGVYSHHTVPDQKDTARR